MRADATIHEIDFRNGLPDAADRARFDEDGVVVVRNFVEASLLDGIVSDLRGRIALLERHYGLSSGGDGDLKGLSDRIVALEACRPGAQSVLYDAMSRSPAIHAAAAGPSVIELVGMFVPPPVAHHDRFILLMSMPQKTWHLAGWHQDWYYNEGPASTLTFYAPLQPTDGRNGMLRFALGAHRNGPLAHGSFAADFQTKWDVLDPALVERFDRVAEPSLAPGDVALFDSMVPHSAQVNTSDAIRFVLNLRYHGLDDAAFIEDCWRVRRIDHARTALSRKEEKAA